MSRTARNRSIWYFCVIQFLYCGATCMWNYCYIYFRELGFSGQVIGLISAGGTLLTMIFLPQLGILSDKLRAPGTVFAWQIRILFPLFLLIPVLQILCCAAVVPIAVLASLLWFGVLSGNSVMDSWNGAELEKIGVQFSASRWCGCWHYRFHSGRHRN